MSPTHSGNCHCSILVNFDAGDVLVFTHDKRLHGPAAGPTQTGNSRASHDQLSPAQALRRRRPSLTLGLAGLCFVACDLLEGPARGRRLLWAPLGSSGLLTGHVTAGCLRGTRVLAPD